MSCDNKVEGVEIARQPFSNIGGHKDIIRELRYLIELPQKYPDLVRHKEGILLYGPPGVGKTLLVREIANSIGNCFFQVVQGPELMSKYVGEAEQLLRDIFKKAAWASQDKNLPSFIFFDEIDAILSSRDNSDTQFEIRFVNQFLSLVDGFKDRGNIVIIGATNRPHSIDPAAKRQGRFDMEFYVNYPDFNDRREIIKIFIKKYSSNNVQICLRSIDQDFIDSFAEQTENFNGSDIEGVFKRGYEKMKRRCFVLNEETGEFTQEDLAILTKQDLELGLKEYTPHFVRQSQQKIDYYKNAKIQS